MQIASNRRKKTLMTYSKETEFVGDQLLEDQLMEIAASQKKKKRNIDNLDKDEASTSTKRVSDDSQIQ